ncbi:DNA cytosine methyltransferase [Oerskovia paurometabola]|uniref:DNA cytosine methyltransferase n=1 Tax=Oerskovia paurometabola TaxID=162170 RepID=UPI003445378D
MSELGVVEICAGAGGQSLGLHLAGFRHRLAIEIDVKAASTLRKNLARIQPDDDATKIVAIGDVADSTVWDPESFRGVDLLAGGVPCPPFSIAGKQLGANDERDLFAWAVELAGRMQPRAILLENVRGLSSPRFAGYRQAVIDRFDELGYEADWELLHASDYGVPQSRPRFVLVALRPEDAPYFKWPEKKPTNETVGTTLFDLMAARGWPGAEAWAMERAIGIAPTIVGGSKKHGGADLGPTRAKRAWAGLGVDGLGIANEAPGPDVDSSFTPKLTCQMVERLQGWNGAEYEWQFEGAKTSHYRQVGNAFPPPVARAVGDSIARALLHEGTPRANAPERTAHDEVYRVLRDAGDWVTMSKMQRLLGSAFTSTEVALRIDALAHDFEIESAIRGGRPAWRLGEFKAFRGEDDHQRHIAFTQQRLRGQIS